MYYVSVKSGSVLLYNSQYSVPVHTFGHGLGIKSAVVNGNKVICETASSTLVYRIENDCVYLESSL